jgi:1,2-dihydroxy-3-keto-5-methylthiopentene dioxygenase
MRAYLLQDPTTPINSDELAKHGVQSWSVASEETLRTTFISAIKRERGYVDEDVVSLDDATPNIDSICAKFDKEHFHTEDEVRLVLEGEGIFDVRNDKDGWMRIEVGEGDMIVIPARTYHRFSLTGLRKIRCMRLFTNHDGWSPLYRSQA